jgi:phosphoribosylcarboxyaminoimidazole (NCAIR) mutase
MDRKLFFKSISLLPFVGKPVSANLLRSFSSVFQFPVQIPILFICPARKKEKATLFNIKSLDTSYQ